MRKAKTIRFRRGSEYSLDQELAEMLYAAGIKTGKQVDALKEKFADIRIQAMMFDMDIDIETWSLVPKSTYKEAVWLTRWKEKRDASDNLPDSAEQAGWEDWNE